MNLYGFKRYRNGRVMAEGAKVVAENEDEALVQCRALYWRDLDARYDTFEVANVYELPVPSENKDA